MDALKAFVEAGGIVVTLNGACEFGDEGPGRAGPERPSRRSSRTKFFCPDIDPQDRGGQPFAHGLRHAGGGAAAFRQTAWPSTPGFPRAEWDRQVVAGYPETDVLLSGWLLGEDILARQAAVVDTQYKKGRIILIGIRCQNRAQSHGTYKFLLNALLYPEAN